MRKLLICLLITGIFLSGGIVLAEEVNWDSIGNPDNAWDGQKIITNKEFEKIVTELEKRKDKGKKNKKQIKGKEMSKANETELLSNIDSALPLLNLPVSAVIGDKIFYQGHYLLAQAEAYETDDDFNSESIYFLKYDTLPNHTLKIMFGSMEFNAFTFVTYLDN